jgi:zinc/manganese transport system permease protein
VLFGIVASYAGLVISYHYGLPSGPVIILCCGVIFMISLIFGRAGGVLRLLGQSRHLEA